MPNYSSHKTQMHSFIVPNPRNFDERIPQADESKDAKCLFGDSIKHELRRVAPL